LEEKVVVVWVCDMVEGVRRDIWCVGGSEGTFIKLHWAPGNCLAMMSAADRRAKYR